MAIRWQCVCGQALEVPDDFPQRVTTCPKCIRSVAVPFPEGPLSAEAARYLKGAENRGNTKKLAKPVKCTYCGWLIWSAEATECPKCLRKIEKPSALTTVVSFAILTLVLGLGYYGYQRWRTGDMGVQLAAEARRWVKQLPADWKVLDDAEREYLERVFPGALQPGKEMEAITDPIEVKYLGHVDGHWQGRVTFRITLIVVDPTKASDDPARKVPRGVATVEQRLRFDPKRPAWVPVGDPDVIDRKM